MLTKKVYIPIGVCLLLLLAIGFLALRSDVPDGPVKIYKATQPAETSETQTETATSDTAQGGHSHADRTFHVEPHRKATPQNKEETPQEKFDREMLEKMAQKDQKIAALKAEIEAIKARDAERTEYLSQITEKGKEFAANFQDVLAMTPDQYLALSETQQEDFLLRCVEYDLFVEDMQGIIHSMPQWVIDELNDLRPGEVDEFLNLPLLHELYGRL